MIFESNGFSMGLSTAKKIKALCSLKLILDLGIFKSFFKSLIKFLANFKFSEGMDLSTKAEK